MMIELKEALRIVLEAARPLGTERVELHEAWGRVLAEDVAADMDLPPFDKATVDGYACRRADLGYPLTLIEIIPAGRVPTRVVGPNQCAKIMTGAAMPSGADCVVMIEQTEAAGDNAIRFAGGPTPDNIFRRAMDVRVGQIVLRKGSRIGAPQVAELASVGCVQPLVARRPRVGVIATGDELVMPAARPGRSQIRDSNRPQLVVHLAALGLKARDYGIIRDVAADTDQALSTALRENDLVLVSGGVSVGDFDLVPAAMERNNVRLLFEKIAVKPGKPVVFGITEGAYCFGLPGNPVSTFVVFELLVKPFLYRLMGHEHTPVCVQMRLDETIARNDTERQYWIPVRITSPEAVRPVPYHGSPHLSALDETDGLVPMEIGVASLRQGTPVPVRLLRE
jgi:molybdopterin molybdotransferase